jgi:hypothetical protein
MMDWSTVKGAIGTFAPWIAGTLGTPVAGVAVKALCDVFGLSPDKATPDSVTAALAGATPDQLLALKSADQKHQEFMAQLGFDHIEKLQSIGAGDRDSARNREIQIKDRTPAHLAYMVIGGFFSISLAQLVALMGWPEVTAKIPPQGWVIIGNISGYLAAEAKSAAAYYWGSTSDTPQVNDLLAKSTPPGGQQ